MGSNIRKNSTMNESNIITNELPLQLNTINQSSKKNVTKECKLKGHSQTMFTRVGDQKKPKICQHSL